MPRPHAKKLLVEGKAERGAIPQLMAAHVHWGDDEDEWPIFTHVYDGADVLLAEGTIQNHFKEPGVETVGVIVDANDEFDSRWARVRNQCIEQFPELPDDFPVTGLIQTNPEGKRLGVWIMPDNRSRGMLETFLSFLVSGEQESVWKYVQRVVTEARKRGAPYKDQHRDKARIYTYLAWQDEPGMLFGTAIAAKCLDPHSEHAIPFVTWFKTLYELDG